MLTTQNRRFFERIPFFAKVMISVLPSGSPVEGRSVDISLNGVGIMSASPLPVGHPVSLTFHLSTRKGPAVERVCGHITNVRFDDDSTFVGIEFAEVLNDHNAPALVREIARR